VVVRIGLIPLEGGLRCAAKTIDRRLFSDDAIVMANDDAIGRGVNFDRSPDRVCRHRVSVVVEARQAGLYARSVRALRPHNRAIHEVGIRWQVTDTTTNGGATMSVLVGKVIIVTGGTSGIGARTAERFVQEGANVVIAGRRQEQGEALAKHLEPGASFIRTDVTKEQDVEAMISHAVAKFGKLDCLFNNAGNAAQLSSIADTDMALYDETMNVHVRGVILGMKYAVPALLQNGSGSIINTGSQSGLRAGISGHLYSLAKAAVIHLTRCVAWELAGKNIRVNSISPGSIPTGIFGKSVGLADTEADELADKLQAFFAGAQPIPRAGKPTDIANAAVFLASDASSFITGHDLVVDGGNIAGRRDWSTLVARREQVSMLIKSLQAQKHAQSTTSL
jgi:NAD(P)-dependent dehydrogenase (short-subunit alcohol dehydrogenase family)